MLLALVQSLFKVYLSSNSRAYKQLEPAILSFPVLCPTRGKCVGPLHWLIQHSHWEKNSPPSEKEGWRSMEKKKKGIKMNSKPSKRYLFIFLLSFSLRPTLLSRPPTQESPLFASFTDGDPLKAVWGVLFFSSSHPLPLSSVCQLTDLWITWTPLHSLLYNYPQHEPSQMELASTNADHYWKCWRLIWVKRLSSERPRKAISLFEILLSVKITLKWQKKTSQKDVKIWCIFFFGSFH